MEQTDVQASDCLKPLIGILLGFACGLLFAWKVHPDWEGTEWGFMFPRWLALVSAAIFWCVGVLARGRRLYCGGIKKLQKQDRRNIGFRGTIVLFVYVAAILAYATAEVAAFMLCTAIILVMITGEVGYGKPWGGIHSLIRLVR